MLTSDILEYQVMEACSTCLHQRNVFTQQVLANVLNQLVIFLRELFCILRVLIWQAKELKSSDTTVLLLMKLFTNSDYKDAYL